jgi:hypothetical protein
VIFFRNEPFVVVITGSQQFSFQWCELPAFQVELKTGALTY